MPNIPQPPTSSAFDLAIGPNPVWTRWFLQVFNRLGGSVGDTIPEISAALAATQTDVSDLQVDVLALDARVDALEAAGPVGLPAYSKASLPAATPAGQMVYVTDETGGAVPAFSDGTAWRRVTDRAVVS